MASSWCFDETDLSNSFDDSMTGIGADFMSSMFNMRDALSALPLCDESPYPSEDVKLGYRNSSSSSGTRRPAVRSICRIETCLHAPTSSATRFNEASLTYLNQGQTYELVMQWNVVPVAPTKAVIKIRFHEPRMELREREHLKNWRDDHPGERLLDVDHSRSCDFVDLSVDSTNPNTVVCVWSGRQCTVGIRLNCIGTEFTIKKHGGEKGIPFRLQVDYLNAETGQYIESCACQVKVFKMKGADRKHRTDREKLDRKSREGRALYRPSCPTTKLTYLPAGRCGALYTELDSATVTDPPYISHDHQPKPISGDSSVDTEHSTCISNPCNGSPRNGENSTSIRLSTRSAYPVFVKSKQEVPFVAPSQAPQRLAPVRSQRSSSGPQLSRSPNRRLSATVSSNLQRRRRQRGMDSCVGTCSACGRSCRSHGGRWMRANKARPCCAHWDITANSRPKQTAWLPEKRRASHSFDPNSSMLFPHPIDAATHTVAKEVVLPHTQELSTSAESSLGNDELNKWTIVDKCSEESELTSGTVALRLGPTGAHRRGLPQPNLSTHDTGYSSDLLATDLEPVHRDKIMKTAPLGTEAPVWSELGGASLTDTHSPKTVSTAADGIVDGSLLVEQSNGLSTATDQPCIVAEMGTEEVCNWLRSASFGNLVDTFQTFTGKDMLRLTKDDFTTLCGVVEGLRLYNAFYNRPARPRCTLYVCRKDTAVHQAVMLYELTRDELLRRVAPIVSACLDQIQLFCLLTTHGLPVLLTNELVAQLEHQSCYEAELRWQPQRKAHLFLRPTLRNAHFNSTQHS